MVRLLLLILAAAPGFAWAAEPELTQVVLSSGGVGQFSFSVKAEGRDSISLDVPLDQVDDVLKSLQVEDPAGGLAVVRLQGREPLAETFRTLPFGPAAFASPEALLAGLVGETVRLPSDPPVVGQILAVSAFAQPSGSEQRPVQRHRLTIATPVGIASVVLEDTPAIDFTSDALRSQIAAALSAIAGQRVHDRRTLQLALDDGGSRTVRFNYVVAAPVWKASYRLTLPADGADAARLEGFAVVENLSGRDWHGVQVVLTSGQPVLYHQPLYQAVFAPRPEAPVDMADRLTPDLDQGAVAVRPPPPPPAPLAMPEQPAPQDAVTSRARASQPAVAVQQAIAQVQFRMAEPVKAASGESLLLPIIDRQAPAQRVSLFRASSSDLHPLVALLLTNDGPGAIPPGLATLFDAKQGGSGAASFIGDARLPATQPGEQRLASFAADLAVRVDSDQHELETMLGAVASRGVLRVTRRTDRRTTYRVTTPASGGRRMLIEQPKVEGAEVVEPTTGVSDTPTAHRIAFDAPPGATTTMTVVEQRMVGEELTLSELQPDELLTLSHKGQISTALRAAFERAAVLHAELDERSGAVAELKRQIDELVADQDRVRKNLAAVPSGDLQRRYVAQLQSQENQLAQLRSQQDSARRAMASAGKVLNDFLALLSL